MVRPIDARSAEPKRSLTHVGGATRSRGDATLVRVLVRALDVQGALEQGGEEASRRHIHGFHTYPARMHPDTARELILGLSEPHDTVLDPFCGSGTVPIEARAAGRRALGSDINPLAVRLARTKLASASDAELARLREAAARVAAVAAERREQKSGASRRYPAEDVALFDPHVLLELDGLRVGMEREIEREGGLVADALALLLSAILVKLSKQRGDTARGRRELRVAAGFPTRLYVDKAEELARDLREVRALYAEAPPGVAREDDARALREVAPRSVALVVSSPPYPGVYDYVEHHRLRLRWLGLPTRGFEAREIGARRALADMPAAQARAAFTAQLGAVLGAVERALAPNGRAVLLIADGASGRTPIRSDEAVRAAGHAAGLVIAASSSQSRPHFHRETQLAFGRERRFEHAIVLERRGDGSSSGQKETG